MEPKDSPYYLGNRQCPPTSFVFKNGYEVITQELPWDANSEDLGEAFFTAITHVFDEKQVLDAIKDFTPETAHRLHNTRCISGIEMSIKSKENVITVEIEKYADINSILRAIITLCVGITYSRESAYETLHDIYERRMLIEEKPKEDE